MVKTTREGENRRSPRTASSAGIRLKEEQTASQIRSPGSMKGDTPVDPTEPPDSKFVTASKQPALTLVALAAAEDHGRQLPDSAFASENQAACMNPTCAYTAPARDSPLFPNEPAITHSATSACFAPARDSPLFSNEPALLPITGEDLSPPPVGSTDLQKTDAAPSAAASSPGNPRESDGSTGDACKSISGTRGFRAAIMYDATLGTRTLGEVRGSRTSEEDLWGRDGTTASAPGGALGRVTASLGNPRGTDGPSRGGALAEGSTFEEPRPPPEEPRFLPTRLFLEQRPDLCSSRPDLSSSRQASRHAALTKISPSSARHNVSHLGRAPPDFPSVSLSLPHVPSSGYFPNLVRADPLKAQDGHSLERLQRIIGRNRIEGAAPARKAEGLDTTPGPASVELDFAGEEPEAVEENLAGGKSGPSAEDRPDRLAEHGTTRGLEHQVKVDQFQGFISRLPMAERLRVLGLPELHAVSSPVKTPSIRSAVELSKEDQVSDALPRGKFRSAEGDNSFHAAPRNFSNPGRAEFHAPPVITRGGQAAREMQERAISPAVAQDKTAAASARLVQAFPYVHVTHFAQLSSDAQPRPTQKTLVTRSSQPVPNAIYYAPENDDPNAHLNSPHDVFTSGNLSAEISRL